MESRSSEGTHSPIFQLLSQRRREGLGAWGANVIEKSGYFLQLSCKWIRADRHCGPRRWAPNILNMCLYSFLNNIIKARFGDYNTLLFLKLNNFVCVCALAQACMFYKQSISSMSGCHYENSSVTYCSYGPINLTYDRV